MAGLIKGGAAVHCFLLIADNCDPAKDEVQINVTNLAAAPERDFSTALNINAKYYDVGGDCKTCAKAKTQAGKYIPVPYNRDGPNSNTYVKYIVNELALTDPFASGGTAPHGWNHSRSGAVWSP